MSFLLHRTSGEVVPINPAEYRYARLRVRVTQWAETASQYRASGKTPVLLKMITLTYHGVNALGEIEPDYGWKPNHIRDFMRHVRRHCGNGLLGYAWVAELQKRGAVHYHILLLVRPGCKHIPYPDKAGWWPFGMSRIHTARSPFYIVKYLQKVRFQNSENVLEFPKGLRMFSVWFAPRLLDIAARWLFRTTTLPRWLSALLIAEFRLADWKRAAGGGYVISDRACPPFFVGSPWKFVFCP